MVAGKDSVLRSDIMNTSYDNASDQSISINAFCMTDDLCHIMENAKADRRMNQVDMRVIKGSIVEAVSLFSNSSTPNLIILHTKGNAKEILQALDPLADVCDPITKVIIIGDSSDTSLHKKLISNGISEYLFEPLSAKDIIRAVSNIFDISEEQFGKAIAFIGSRGGAGSSTIAHNCAFSIASIFSEKTVLADLDLPYGTSNINFDKDPLKGISDAIYTSSKIDRFVVDSLLISYCENLSLLTSSSTLERTYDFDSKDILPVLDILHRSSTFTIIDMPHLWNKWSRDILVGSDKVVVVTSLDLVGLRNSKNLIDELKKLRGNDESIYLVINQAGIPKRPEISIEDFCSPLCIKPSAIIPCDSNVFGMAANAGKMVCDMYPKSSITNIFSNFVHIIADRVTMNKSKYGIYSKIKSFLKLG